MASIIDNILTIQESYIAGVKKDANNAYRGDMLKAVFQNGPHLSSGLVVEERVKAFFNKFFDQASVFLLEL